MERTTRADLARALGWLCEAAGKAPGYDEGQWSLECWNGWVIVEKTSGGGERHPFGSRRRAARAMYDAMTFAQQAFFLANGKD